MNDMTPEQKELFQDVLGIRNFDPVDSTIEFGDEWVEIKELFRIVNYLKSIGIKP